MSLQLNSTAAALRHRSHNEDPVHQLPAFETRDMKMLNRDLTVQTASHHHHLGREDDDGDQVTTLMPVPKTWSSFLYNLVLIPMLYGTAQGLGSAMASWILFRFGWRKVDFSIATVAERKK